MHQISSLFFISVILRDTGFDLPDPVSGRITNTENSLLEDITTIIKNIW
jgi:hypothetical protein